MRMDAVHEAKLVARLRAAGCVFAEDEARLLIEAAATAADLEAMTAKRVEGVPLEYLLGFVEFHGLRIAIDPGVFVPRQRTAFLVDTALSLCAPDAVVLDLCCGSGALGAAVAAALPGVELWAADVDPVATCNARRNIHGAGRVVTGDLFAPLPRALRGRVDILLANTPYVPTAAIDTMPPEARLFEALVALDGGSDGLDVQRRVAAEVPQWLATGGHLLVETSDRQTEATAAIFDSAGLDSRIAEDDELGATIVIGTLR